MNLYYLKYSYNVHHFCQYCCLPQIRGILKVQCSNERNSVQLSKIIKTEAMTEPYLLCTCYFSFFSENTTPSAVGWNDWPVEFADSYKH